MFYYIKNHEFTKAQLLASQLNITERTIRGDIQVINDILEPFQLQINLKRKYGYYLEISNQELYEEFLVQLDSQKKSTLDTPSDRIKYILKTLLYRNDYITLEELSQDIYISKNTIQNYIKQIKQTISTYNLEYITKVNYGVKVIGNEDDKRKCLIDQVFAHDFENYVVGFSHEERAIFKGIDLEYIQKVIIHSLDAQNIKTTDFSLKNLIIHSALMISRIQNDCYIHTNNQLKIPKKTSYIVENICKQFEDYFHITISNGEKQYFYLHLVANTDYEVSSLNVDDIRSKVKHLLNIVYFDYSFDLRNDEILVNDLFYHFQSILTNKTFSINKRNPLLNTIKANFPLAFDITLTSTSKVFSSPPYTLNEDEVGYVSLHIGAAIERCFSGQIQRKSTILVCGSGQATTRMLEARLNAYFNDKITIVRKASYKEFISYTERELKNVDFVISTIPIESPYIPAIVVDFSLTNDDIESISHFLSNMSIDKTQKTSQFFDESLFIKLKSVKDKNHLIRMLCEKLEENHIVNKNYYESVIKRETLAKTNMSDFFALPHPMEVCANETKVAVALLDDPLLWDENDTVQIVFLIAIKQGEQNDIEHLYDVFIEIVNNNKLQQSITHCQNYQQFIEILSQNID
ncbi:BglG family transcription antiterminator [Coprobacillus sp. AF33-1AC]|uniref:BglG family transcription antiterminator n=1 Tax=Coprobacillus sp. AF33-1AC TaxID=2292032 RepID=UPI002101C21D|nr:BglG family transcription antiterminator [Coprobacillus sp. AF33-1AC]